MDVLIDEVYITNYLKIKFNGFEQDSLLHDYVEAFKIAASGDNSQTLLALNTNSWKISIKKNLVTPFLTGAILTAVFRHLGYNQLPLAILPAVLPYLLDIEKVKIEKREERLYLQIPIKKFKNQFKSAEEWYSILPDKIKASVNLEDFRDFLDNLVVAGYAKENKNEKFQLLKQGENIFKISFV